jgi:hypothetical protein
MSLEIFAVLLSMCGVGIAVDGRISEKIKEQNTRIDRLIESNISIDTQIHDITLYIKGYGSRLTKAEEDIKYILDLNGRSVDPVTKRRKDDDDDTDYTTMRKGQ